MGGKEKLDRRTVKEIEGFLREKHAQLQAAVRTGVAERRTNGNGRSADVTVQATETLHDEIQVALMDRHSRQVAQIEAALERLARGKYGICHDCQDFIGLARLRALPFAQRCSHCQSRAEIRARAVAPKLAPSILAADAA